MKQKETENCHKGHREHVRHRFMTSGLEAFAAHEILELLLFYSIPQKDTNPLAHKLMETYGSLFGVLSAPVEDLITIDGVGERTAVLLSLIFQVGRWIRLEQMSGTGVNFLSTESAGQYCKELFCGQHNEAAYELCLNQRGNLLTCNCMANGNIRSVSLDIRTLIKNAVLSHADSILLTHNHPGGDAMPSPEDCNATRYIEEALDRVNIRLRDHIVVGEHDIVSMRDAGYLK